VLETGQLGPIEMEYEEKKIQASIFPIDVSLLLVGG